jgi:spore germination protein KC
VGGKEEGKKVIKYILQFIFIVSCLGLLTSCGYKDIDKRAFVVSIGIDKATDMEKGYEVNLKIAIPESEAKQQSKEFLLLSEKGETIAEVVRIIKAKASNELDFGHMKMIVLGDSVVQEDITQIMDWFSRRRDIQQIAFIGIGKPDAKSVLTLQPKGERIPSNTLFLFFGQTGTESPYVTTNYLFHFRRNLVERGIDASLPIIEAKDSNFSITSLSLIKDGKEALPLTPDQTMLLNVLNKGFDKVSFSVPFEEEKSFVLSLDQLSTNFTINTKDKGFIKYNVDFSAIIEESMFKINGEKLEAYSKKAEEVIKKRVEELFQLFQQHEVDPMGFGLRYRATNMGEESEKWKKWQEIYPKITFQIQVKGEIKSTGIIE